MAAPHVKHLRASMTDAERKLWYALRSRSIGPKFRRQVPLGPFIVDFACFEMKIIVEVDGSQHAKNQHDVARDLYFNERGYRVLRFWNNDVLRNLDGVLQAIFAATDPSPGAPNDGAPPSPSRGEGRTARVARALK
jgi:very-short-patch-repair endonuclease